MLISIRIIVSVLLLWLTAGITFVFGFRTIKWTGWEGALPWMCGVVALFVCTAFTCKWLIEQGNTRG